MATREPCVTDEWYHCYNRGVDKRKVFAQRDDYERFMGLLYVCNGTKTETISDQYRKDLQSLLTDGAVVRGDPLVDIGAFSLMPSHVHLLLRQLQDGGIARFMQKVFTGYTMYFNVRNERTGSLFGGTYKAKHIDDDRYLKQVVPYVLLNPAELIDSRWKKGKGNPEKIKRVLLEYPYASARTFFGQESPLKSIAGTSLHEYYDRVPSVSEMIHEAHEYYRSESPEV